MIQLSENDEWYTPASLVARFGKFDYDPATTERKAKEFEVEVFDTITTDGLKRDWTKFRRIWINPPFTRKAEFLEKAVETYKKVKNEIYFLCPIAFLTTKTFHRLCARGGVVYLPNGRLAFENYDGNVRRATAFGSVVIKLADHWELKILDLGGK